MLRPVNRRRQHDPLFQAVQGALQFGDAEGVVFDGAPLFPVEDPRHMLADGASGMGVEVGEGVPVLCLEAVQDCLEDGVGVVGEAPPRCAHRVDGTTPRVFQDAADIPQGLVRRVVSAVSFAFMGCGRYAVGVPFLELVAPGGEERTEVGVSVSCFGRAGAQQGGEFLFRGPDFMDELLEGEVRWCSGVADVALQVAC